jgi:hypothetical protein
MSSSKKYEEDGRLFVGQHPEYADDGITTMVENEGFVGTR